MKEKKPFHLNFPAPLLKALRIVAAHEEEPVAEIIRRACRRYLQQHHRDFYDGFMSRIKPD